jgi:hypothetical protein
MARSINGFRLFQNLLTEDMTNAAKPSFKKKPDLDFIGLVCSGPLGFAAKLNVKHSNDN